MSNTEALRCADEIGGLPVSDFCEALGDDAAAHIRRLVAENEALLEANRSFASASILPDDKMIMNRADYAELTVKCFAFNELVEALRQIAEQHGQWNNGMWAARIARAALAKAQGESR